MSGEDQGRWRRLWRSTTIRRSLEYCFLSHRKRVAAIAICTVLQSVLGLAPVLIIKAFVDDLQRRNASVAYFAALLGAGAALVIAAGFLGVLRSWLVLTVKTRVIAELRQAIAERLLGQSIGYFTRSRGGELMSRMLNDVSSVESMFDSLLAAATSAIVIVGTVVVMFVVEWHLALLTLLIVPVLVLTLRLGGRPIYRRRMLVQERLATLTSQLQESLSLSGMMLVKSFGRERTERERFAELNDELRTSQVTAGMAVSWIGLGLNLLQFLGPAGLLLAGAWLVLHGYITLGTLAAFVTVLGLRFASSVSGLGNGVVSVIGALPAWSRIFEVLDGTVEITDRAGATPLVDPRGGVRFDDVTFSYPGRNEPVLHEISLDVAPGQLVAIVGPSGAGKTTLCSLVPRFYDPQHGAVRIDGHDVRAVTLDSLGRVAGLVFQDTYLFHGTLRDNLVYARPEATDEQLESACSDAQLGDVIATLPEGLDTLVGERGHRLSGGEKQRVAIARVILKGAPILILDEATSHLDSLSEQLVQKALSRLFVGRTSLVIAHRLSTVLAADLIVVVDRGRIVEQGTHAELVAAGGLYRALYEMQFRPGQSEPVPA
jgi:ATP-binding cassette subfamily B protein